MTEWKPRFAVSGDAICRDGCQPSVKASEYVHNQLYPIMYSDTINGTVDNTYRQFFVNFQSDLARWMHYPEGTQIGFYPSLNAFLHDLDRTVAKMQDAVPQTNAVKKLGVQTRAQWINWVMTIPHEEDKIKVDVGSDVGETMGMCYENGQVAVLYQNTRDKEVVTRVLEEKDASQFYVSVIDDSMNAWKLGAVARAIMQRNIVVRNAYNSVLVFYPPYFAKEQDLEAPNPPEVNVRSFYEFAMMRYEMKRLADLSSDALRGAAMLWLTKTVQQLELYSPFLQVVAAQPLSVGGQPETFVQDKQWIGEVRWEIGVRVCTLDGEVLSKAQVLPVRALPREGNTFFLSMTPDMFCHMCSSTQKSRVFQSDKAVITAFLTELIKLTLIPDVLAPTPSFSDQLPPPPPPPSATDPTVATTGYVPPTMPARQRSTTYDVPVYETAAMKAGDLLQPMRQELRDKKQE